MHAIGIPKFVEINRHKLITNEKKNGTKKVSVTLNESGSFVFAATAPTMPM